MGCSFQALWPEEQYRRTVEKLSVYFCMQMCKKIQNRANNTIILWVFFKRLLIAKEFGDRSAERRAYSNLGNAYIFLGEFETASEYYKSVDCLEIEFIPLLVQFASVVSST